MVAKQSNLEIDSFTTLRRKWKCSILKIVSFTKLKTEKVKNIVKIEKYIFKTKACDSFSLDLFKSLVVLWIVNTVNELIHLRHIIHQNPLCDVPICP